MKSRELLYERKRRLEKPVCVGRTDNKLWRCPVLNKLVRMRRFKIEEEGISYIEFLTSHGFAANVAAGKFYLDVPEKPKVDIKATVYLPGDHSVGIWDGQMEIDFGLKIDCFDDEEWRKELRGDLQLVMAAI